MSVFVTRTIVGSALLEGGALANLIAYMLEGQWFSLVLGIVLALGIAAGVPTRDGVESWVERQLRRLDEIRSMPRRQP